MTWRRSRNRSDRRKLIEEQVKAVEQHPNAAAIEVLLDTPLPSAAARKRLLTARDRAIETLPGDIPKKPYRAPAPARMDKDRRTGKPTWRVQLAALAGPAPAFPSLDAAGRQRITRWTSGRGRRSSSSVRNWAVLPRASRPHPARPCLRRFHGRQPLRPLPATGRRPRCGPRSR